MPNGNNNNKNIKLAESLKKQTNKIAAHKKKKDDYDKCITAMNEKGLWQQQRKKKYSHWYASI